MPAPIPPGDASWSVTDSRVIQNCLGEVQGQFNFRGVAYRIEVKAKNATEPEACPSLSEAVIRKPREITLVSQEDDYRIRVIGVFGPRPKCVQLRIDGTLPESMKLLVDVLVRAIDSQCKGPTGGPRYWLGRLWRWFFAKVTTGVVVAILAPLLVGAALMARAWFAG